MFRNFIDVFLATSIIVSIIILLCLVSLTKVHAEISIVNNYVEQLSDIKTSVNHEVKQEDISELLELKYTIRKKISKKILDKREEIIVDTLESIDYIKDINITVVLSEYSTNEVNGLINRKIDGRYYIIICNNYNYNVRSTMIHELGHLIRYEYVDLDAYKQICYKNKDIYFEEEFAEDFRFWFDKKYEKRSELKYSIKFKFLMQNILRKINKIGEYTYAN